MVEEADAAREELLDVASMNDEALMEAMLEENVTVELIMAAIRKGCIARTLTPVYLGSAYKNKAVQPLLDGVISYLPDPTEVVNEALVIGKEDEKVILDADPNKPTVALAFKLEDGRYGQLSYLRVYQGSLKRDDTIFNARTGKKVKVGRLVRMHSDEMEEIQQASAGDIVAIFGVDCSSGDTFTDGKLDVVMTSMHVPEPVISMAVRPDDHASETQLSKALRRFSKEDPTFRVHVDAESNETIIAGMGELHLEVYLERMKREYKAAVSVSPPQVAYRETLTKRVRFDYTHKKQTGGSGQFGRVAGWIEPNEDAEFEFEDKIKGGVIPKPYIPAVRKGFESCLPKGMKLGFPVVNIKITLEDGKAHAVDSSEVAFQESARGAWRSVFHQAGPKILEPIMKVEVEGPTEFSGNVMKTLMQRRGMIVDSQEGSITARVEAEVPLAEMFGYSNALRSSTQGKSEFTMEFSRYLQVPEAVSLELIEKAAEAAAAKK